MDNNDNKCRTRMQQDIASKQVLWCQSTNQAIRNLEVAHDFKHASLKFTKTFKKHPGMPW